VGDNKKRVLIVDDEPGLLKVLKVRLELEGYEVITAHDGQEAMRLFDLTSPDILLLDLLMPVMDGFEVLKKLGGSSKVPVIAFSANRDLVKRALEMGANVFLAKPFEPDRMVDEVKELLGNN
jgi:DNA-binding response OmpR family regulator